MALRVSSSAFPDGEPIPVAYTCEGNDIAPPIAWTGHPPSTRSFAVICDDPDAPMGTFTHWVLYDVPASVTAIAEDARDVGVPGVNSFRREGYGGPCPPPGAAHHYVFHVYALDVPSLGEPGLTKSQALAAMKGHVLAEGRCVGTFARGRPRALRHH